ncbi:MFS transporter [Fructobacillus papyrifericola]|uniref:MFS transporter n=1 Tax=Fructobacillus papyrifericola TaxID=2713172 RepID=A0ABS5QU02_9LACO|nr:MFS transporter [Fructobacillus papyrifericola]MBS9336685.1 MFS transporter [Fructobacillus papyrifericola]
MGIIQDYLRKPTYRSLLFSNVAEALGASLFNITMVIYAGMMPSHAEQGWALTIVGIANFVPGLYQMLTGYFADQKPEKVRSARRLKFVQALAYFFLALFINQPFSWLLFALIIFVNVFSDSIGNYSTSLLMPILQKSIRNDDRERMTGFANGVLQTASLAGQFLGSTVIVLLAYNYASFAIMNALLFVLSALFLFRIKKALPASNPAESAKVSDQEAKPKFLVALLAALKDVFSVRLLGWYVSIYTLSGFIGAAIGEVSVLAFLRRPSMQIVNFGFSVATMETVFAVGAILGALLPLPFMRQKTIAEALSLQMMSILAVVLAFFYTCPFYITFLLMFICAFCQGQVQPKLSAWVVNNTKDQRLALSMSIISTATTFTLPVGQLIFMSVANLWSVQLSFGLMAAYTIVLIFYVRFVRLKEQKA